MSSSRDAAPRSGARWSRRFRIALLLGTMTWWSTSGVADAHTGLSGSTPADGAVVTEPITEIRFSFTEAVEPFEAGFALVTFDGSTLPIDSIGQPDPATVIVVPAEPIEVPVEARWAIVSGDSHPLTGSILLAVDIPTPPTTSTTTTAPPTTTAGAASGAGDSEDPDATSDESRTPGVDEQLEILRDRVARTDSSTTPQLISGVIRWVTYAATALVIGGMTLAVVAGWRGTEVWQVTVRQLWLGVTVLALSTVLAVGGQLAELNGDAADLLSVRSWGDVFEGRFRTGVLVRLAGAAIVAIALLLRQPQRRWVLAAGAAGVIGSYPILGHGDSGWLDTPATLIHVGAISVWAGGLGTVLLLAKRVQRSQFLRVTRIFSGLAGVALATTVLTGVALTIARIDAASELYSSDYGRRLLLKIGLVAVVTGLGAVHRYRTVPRLQNGAADGTASFVRLAVLELAGFSAVLATTAWLVIGSS